MRRILEKAAQAKHADLEAWETALRAAVLSAGAQALAGLLQGLGCGRREATVWCECGSRMESQGLQGKALLTILGPVGYERSLFQCPACKKTCYPGDEELDLVGTTRSPGLRRMMARAGSQSPFKEGRQDLKMYAGIEVSAKDVERVAERIGQDMEAWSRRERASLLQGLQPEPIEKTGCKTLVGQRLKQSGMEWSLRGANAIISLRCIMKSGRFEEYWEARAG